MADYLASVTAMPSYVDRELHMHEWRDHFSGRVPNNIKPMEIRARLHALRQTLAASSCNKRRTALMHFYTVTNGKSGYNPVRDVPKFEEESEPRDQSLWTLYRILALMRPSQTRARLRVMVWTGWPHAQLKRLKPTHLDLEHAKAFVTPRRKGKGRKGVWLPLLPGAVRALREFIKEDCFGPFSNSAMHSSFARAVAKLNARRGTRIDAHPYDIRHSFGTWVADHITDERALQELMMHATAAQSRRYTQRSTEKRVTTAVATLGNIKKLA